MNFTAIIEKYYPTGSLAYKILVNHSTDVARKALAIAARRLSLGVDVAFVHEAAMLHDIGICKTNAPSIQCFGREDYLRHGILGAEMLRAAGWPRHARVCERHTGTGLTREEIITKKLPLPHIDLLPETIEEQLICFADCFFSKTKLGQEKSVEEIRRKIQKFGTRSRQQFDAWCDLFL